MFPATSLIPIRDDNPTRSVPVVTIGLIVVNILVFFLEPNLGVGADCNLVQFLYKWGVVPRELTQGEALTGAVRCNSSIPGANAVQLLPKSIYVSLLTSMFLHGGLFHIAGNMLFLWVFGNNIEDSIGKVRYLIFYLVTGLLAAAAHVFGNPGSVIPTIGASGAVAGILGAYLLLFPRARVTTILPIFIFWQFIQLPAMAVLGFWFISQFFIGAGQQAGGGVAWLAHVGGFAAGALLIYPFGGRRPPKVPRYLPSY